MELDPIENPLHLVNEEIGAVYSVTYINRGDVFRGSKRHTKHGSVLEFREITPSISVKKRGLRVAFVSTPSFLNEDHKTQFATYGEKWYPKLTQKNRHEIAYWLRKINWTIKRVNVSALEEDDPELFWNMR